MTDAALWLLRPDYPAIARSLIGHLDDRRDPSSYYPSCQFKSHRDQTALSRHRLQLKKHSQMDDVDVLNSS